MRRITLILLFITGLLACKKDEKTEDPFNDYPEATCNDSTDDGKFEIWPNSVQDLECSDCTFNSSVLLDYEYLLRIDNRIYSKNSRNSINVYFMPAAALTVNLHLVQKGIVKSNNYVASTNNSEKVINLNQYDMSIFNPGCARLYYYITETGGKNVIDKGHYDIEITQ